ncbi:hypothetical protein BC834DRAFT_871106 [Gloeopeniophorella convolvens]|nr:hypothetical protein BC834DRAFT_871106 [Gloeopeniophorella convolvens]
MPSLPIELFRSVAARVESQPDLLRLRLTNSTLCKFATPLAFRSIRVVSKNESVESLLHILDYPPLSRHVCEVVYQYKEVTTGEMGPHGLCGLNSVLFIKALARLSLFPALESLVLNFGTHPPVNFTATQVPPHIMLQIITFTALLDAAPSPLPLKTLKLTKLLSVPEKHIFAKSIVNFCAPLTSLTIETISPFPDLPLTDARWVSLSVRPIFHSGALSSSLVSLTMHHSVLRSADTPVPFAHIHPPHLAHLSLQRIHFWSDEGTEAFILRHAATLAEMRLFLCPMLLSKSIDLGPPAPYWGSWADVWEGFSTKLRVLDKLVVSECRDSDGLPAEDVSAWYYVNPYGTGVLEIDEADAAEDAAALRRLHEVVESRSAA